MKLFLIKARRVLSLYLHPLRHLELLDWAETLLCNAEKPDHCTENEWRGYRHKWLDEKHRK